MHEDNNSLLSFNHCISVETFLTSKNCVICKLQMQSGWVHLTKTA